MNTVTLVGTIDSDYTYGYEHDGQSYFQTYIRTERPSGIVDRIPVFMPERLAGHCGRVGIRGRYKSYNMYDGDKRRLVLYVLAEEVKQADRNNDINDIFIDGFLTKNPLIRLTPKKRSVAELLIAVNSDNKSDYIPCIVWDGNIRYIEQLEAGSRIRIAGRVQSREHAKGIAYEVSADLIEVIT